MEWRKRGIVWCPESGHPLMSSHAIAPTPFLLSPSVIRVFVTVQDPQGRGRPTYFDVSATDPAKVLGVAPGPLLDVGVPGTFDDNGLMALSVVRGASGQLMMYYVGFELCQQIRYRLFTGLAISDDNGASFKRYSQAPILDRSDSELFFRGGAFALMEEGRFRLWYVAGSSWTEINGKSMPVYDLRYQESPDGIHWADQGRTVLQITDPDEHGFGRPWVTRLPNGQYHLFYSIRRCSYGAYRLGYAESSDGIAWVRRDAAMGLDVSPTGFDSDAIMYSAVITVAGKTYCFYNGNNFGEDGVALAEMVD
ncbi:hypothetical protein FMZ60_14790 [Alcaligenaceae bacterium SJ-26]|nr:hypothetical protein FMZ60_14790 [Alcaligenaceae bacterium SJ-26]